MKKEIEKKFKQEFEAGEVSESEQKLRLKLLHFTGSVSELEKWLTEELESKRVTIDEVEQWMPFWDGFEDSPEPGFVTRWKVEEERKAGNDSAFSC